VRYIFCPDSKLFLLPSIMLREHLLANGEEATIVCSVKLSTRLQDLAVPFITRLDFDTRAVSEGDDLIFFHHNSDAHYEFFKQYALELSRRFNNFTVSFYPDGFGNAMHGRHFARRLAEEENVEVKTREYFSFGFHHRTTVKLAGADPTLIDFLHLARFFDKNAAIGEIVKGVAAALDPERHIIVVPFRAWCTQSFQHGMYDFGSPEDLAKIYLDLTEQVAAKTDKPVQILFRPDERYKQESEITHKALAARYDLVNTAASFPSWLTLEPLLYLLFGAGHIREGSIICLDSTSFQAPAFLLAGVAPIHFTAYMGMEEARLEGYSGGPEFVERKLRKKIDEFADRYALLLEMGLITSLDKAAPSFLIAGIDR
jgi:hypothetical protein